MSSLLDLVPTVLDWYNIPYPTYKVNKSPVQLTGHSLLPVLHTEPHSGWDTVYASHNLHEVTMFYPMRVIRTKQYKLIHNMNYLMPFPIDQDFYISHTFQDMLSRLQHGEPSYWYKTFQEYYYRAPWELYDLTKDPKELTNVAQDSSYDDIKQQLSSQLLRWMNVTADPWICSPIGVLENSGVYKEYPQCMSMDNGLSYKPVNMEEYYNMIHGLK